MKVYERLKMELSNQQYLSEEQYKQYIIENDLEPDETYVKDEMAKRLYFTVIDVLEAVMNDIDIMQDVSTEFADIGQAYQFLEQRVENLKDKIAAIPDPEEEYSNFSLMYTRGGSKTYGGYIKPINRAVLDKILDEELGKNEG